MERTAMHALLVIALLVGGVATIASPAQDTAAQPGQPTRARVWIQNQGRAEAVPVTLQNVAGDVPDVRVQVTGTPTVTLASGTVISSRAVRQRWEYRNVQVGPGDDAAMLLSRAGEDGWETTGLAFAGQAGPTIVLKRPRQP